jgi:fructose-1,6-bisphosphatase
MPFTYAIADLHGRYDLLSEAVTKIVEHSKSDRPATIITLGDYVDRGPKSRQVIERLMDWGSPDLNWSASRAITKISCGSVAVSQSRLDGGWIMVAGPR